MVPAELLEMAATRVLLEPNLNAAFAELPFGHARKLDGIKRKFVYHENLLDQMQD